ncbi:MAG: DUF2383 domain-containing protein [Burkholderiales bacterium]
MLRDDRQAELNELVVRVKDAALRCRDDSGLAREPVLAALFSRLGQRREEMARALEQHLIKLNDLPRAPDADLETVKSLVTYLKTALSTNERQTLLNERIEGECQIQEQIRIARETELPADTQALLDDIAREIAADRNELERLIRRLRTDD